MGLFALANCWQFYRVELYQGLPEGEGRIGASPAGLLIPFCIRFGFFSGKDAFGKYATDASG
jgi:hypothetical protein